MNHPAVKKDSTKSPDFCIRSTTSLADWLFLFHHKVSPALTATSANPTFAKAATQQTISSKSPQKYKFYVVRNTRKIQEMRDSVKHCDNADTQIQRIKNRCHDAGIHLDAMAELAELLKSRIDHKLKSNQGAFTLTHGDLHPGNIVVDPESMKVTGVCDWMNAIYDHRGMDFIKLSTCPGLMPAVFEEYQKLEATAQVGNPLDAEFVYAFATMYSLSWLATSLKGEAGGYEPFFVSTLEHLQKLKTLVPEIYTSISDKILGTASPKLSANTYVQAYDTNPRFCGSHVVAQHHCS